jgi:hypothetical protein
MADGASVDHICIRGTHAHTTSGVEVVFQIDGVPDLVDALVRIEVWVHTRLSSSTKSRTEIRHGMGFVNGGNFTLSAEGPVGTALDVGPSGYTVQLVGNADVLEVRVVAENGAFTHGYIQAWVTERALSG